METENVRKLEYMEIFDIVVNLKYTNHAKERLEERLSKAYPYKVREKAISMNFAYVNTDGFINVALSKNTYLVVKPVSTGYLCITFKEPSHNGYTIYDKFEFAKKGIER